MRVADMAATDLVAVSEIERRSFLTPWSLNALMAELLNPRALNLVARPVDGEAVIGFALGWTVVDEIHVNKMAVHPDHRRRGAGRLLLEALLERGRRLGATEAWLEVRRSNQAAIRLYEGYGFETRGVRSIYYSDTNEDALLMRRVVAPSA